MTKFSAYYPDDVEEQEYLRWLEAPGEGLGQVLGDAPSIEQTLARNRVSSVRKSQTLQTEEPRLVHIPKKKCQKCGGVDYKEINGGVGDCCFRKALPKKDVSSASAEKAKTLKATKRQTGKTGKVRSSYPNETSGKPQQQGQPQSQAKPKANPPQVPSNEQEQGPPVADPAELANTLNMSVHSLQRIAERFRDSKKLGGRAGFVTFMKTRLKALSRKHKLDGDYYGLIFDSLCPKST